ncbi:unannotated protein [freshwater metagenome]|uniref:Unannotated protein n=1 Tax=freshwater metagenome TaxID=449393 RepID=A0A6J7DJ80_9ZZZZ|nr:hypothetical protein [Actinomycetota bacterium]
MIAGQVRALIALRWSMVRDGRARASLLVVFFIPVVLALGAIVVGHLLPAPTDNSSLLVIVPALLLTFLVLSIVTPLAAGGGNELYPPDQLVAFPIQFRTTTFASLVLTPLNLAWLFQVLAALGLVSYLSQSTWIACLAASSTVVAFIAFATTLGQTIGWIVIGVRQTTGGRVLSWLTIAVVSVGFLAIFKAGLLTNALDRSPTIWVLGATLRAANGDWLVWGVRTTTLIASTFGFLATSVFACQWALRQPDKRGHRSKPKATRAASHNKVTTASSLARRIDRAGLWRSPSLRRGVGLLALLPTLTIFLAGSQISLIVLLPGLVAAGSGLLFAINAFCLDGPGALFLSGLPAPAQDWFWRRAQLVAEVASLTSLPVIVIGLARLPHWPSASSVIAVLASACTCIAWITALAMGASVRRPHRALLLGPRDTPAPPGTMALQSVIFSAATTGIGIAFTLTELSGLAWISLVVATGLLTLAARSLRISASVWNEPSQRARVVATVSAG